MVCNFDLSEHVVVAVGLGDLGAQEVHPHEVDPFRGEAPVIKKLSSVPGKHFSLAPMNFRNKLECLFLATGNPFQLIKMFVGKAWRLP
jgi:hypothetical protein